MPTRTNYGENTLSKKSGKLSKKEQRRIAKERAQRMKLMRTWGPIAVVMLGIIIFVVVRLASQRDVEGVTAVQAAISNQHDAELVYAFEDYPLPPLGGPHNPRWQNCGIYDTPVEPQYAVHSMEHGAVWIAYTPDLPVDQVELLEDTARGDAYLLLAPYPGLEEPIVLSVWDRQLAVQSASDPKIDQFITAYRRARGPERAATCDRGIGVPTG